MHYKYVIVGGGAAAASAIRGIREHDATGTVLVLSRENHAPYQRPPLSKDLWFGRSTREQLPIHPESYYRDQNVELALRRDVVELDPDHREVWDERGGKHGYDHLLLATGGRPRLLNVEGDDREGVHYFRSFEDFLFLESRIKQIQHVLVLGGGFIGLELAAALRHMKKEVSLVYPHEYPLFRALPRDLGVAVADYYREHGVETVSGEVVVSLDTDGALLVARTRNSNFITTQLVVVGAGIEPVTDLAEAAGLEVGNGIEVDEFARTSDPNIWAAGDVAEFPDLALERRRRVEHWDHALHHGHAAGANMAGAAKPYTHIPMFYSDFFELGWEAVGDVDSGLETHAVWKEEHREGVVFYLRDDTVRGVLLWNTWGKVDWARELVREKRALSDEVLGAANAVG
jgi:3-phenylpropionate/trans-cinnamate dioxygenase ferredoxin reductase component